MPRDRNEQAYAGKRPLVWILLGTRRGDNNQLFALAKGLGFPFEAKVLSYNRLRHLPFLRGPRLTSLTSASRRLITPPWPDVVMGCGYGSVPVARYIRRQSGGATRIVQIGNPRTSVDDIDLIITTPQYARPVAPNVLALPFPMGDPAAEVAPSGAEEQWLSGLRPPLRLVAIGGPARNWEIDRKKLGNAIAIVRRRCEDDGGTIIAATSPRTDAGTRRCAREMLDPGRHAVVEDFPRFSTLLARCDECYVTADSVSMLSEAILTGKPVGMIPIRLSPRGVLTAWLIRRGMLRRFLPDFPSFWNELREHRLVGTVERPVTSRIEGTLATARDAVLRLLRDGRAESIASKELASGNHRA